MKSFAYVPLFVLRPQFIRVNRVEVARVRLVPGEHNMVVSVAKKNLPSAEKEMECLEKIRR